MAQETGGQFSSDHQELDYSPLQRDEKAHDQRMNESNARIKQAGKLSPIGQKPCIPNCSA